jgi:hypothetical protein
MLINQSINMSTILYQLSLQSPALSVVNINPECSSKGNNTIKLYSIVSLKYSLLECFGRNSLYLYVLISLMLK